MKTAIITDSNSGITRELGQQWGVRIVPMPIIIENETYYEGVDLFPETFFHLLREGKNVSTSQPAPEDILTEWDGALSSGYDEVVYIPMTSGLSSSCQTALILAADYGGRVQVADNHQISVPLKNAVRDALDLAEAGLSAREIKARLEDVGMDSLIYIGVDTLEYLKKGGRVTPAAAAMGTVLGIKPLLTIRGEKLDTFAKVRGTKQCKARLLEAMKKSVAEYRARGWDIRVDASGSFDRREEEEEWRALAAQAFPGEPIQYDPLTLSIASHTGPGAFAMGISRRIPA
ncbi:MAG: DegV family protein [Oscillospiraceae bacterium]|nr:DegV family protein [Oscillospiraceae bacterium]